MGSAIDQRLKFSLPGKKSGNSHDTYQQYEMLIEQQRVGMGKVRN
jgi:hypothetical protein